MNLLQQFVDFLINQKNKPSSLTVKNYKADIAQFIRWFENEFRLAFTPSKITLQVFAKYKTARNLSKSSIERHTSSLRKFFKFLNTEGVMSQNPLEKTAASAEALAEADPWMVTGFKNFLYEERKSSLTIKNYINDVRSFFSWLEEAALTKYAWKITDKNLLSKINSPIVEEYKNRLIAAKFSPLTINRKLSSLRSYIAWAGKQGFISSGHPEFISGSPAIRQDSLQSNEMLKLAQHDKETNYSLFPPLRLMQKSLTGINFLFDFLFILPIAEILEETQYLFWKLTGKKIFKKNLILNKVNDPVQNIRKEFYAPLDISTQYLQVHKRIWHYIRHARPNWYKKYHSYSFTHYLHFGILMILSCTIGFGTYDSLFANRQKDNAILGAATSAPPRILSFQGKLTDSSEIPIAKEANILFSLYGDEDAPSEDALWQENNAVTPDEGGAFSILLGKKTPIPDTAFSQNSKLFLGITVENSPELRPRQELATVPFAGNSETLQGLEPITNTAKTSNVVLALDSSGNLSIAGSKTHTFQTIGGKLVLSGKILSLTTVPGSDSNIEIAPNGIGKIDLSKPIHNSSNNNNVLSAIGAVEFDDSVAILATTSAQSAFTINQNSTGALISAETLGIAKFTVDSDGTGMFAGDLGINGNNLTGSSATFNLLNTGVATLNIGGEATSLILGTATGSAVMKSNIILGNSNANTITFTGRVAQDSSLVPITASGTNNLGAEDLPWDNAYLNNVYAVKLNIQDSQSSTAAAQIFNTNSGTDADGLLLKLGNTSLNTVASTNHFVNFETSGIGIVGSIQGSGGKGVTYATSGIADFAEYFKKDQNQSIPFGSVVCLQDNGLAVPCDFNNSKIMGVASERPAFLGGENLGNGSVAVGLIGQVETLAATLNGKIKTGDLLTASDIQGVAVKTTKAGQIIGKALEDLDSIDESKIAGYYDPENKEYRDKTNFPDIPLKSNIVPIVKINVLVNVSWHDPKAYLAQNGDLIINKTGLNSYSVSNSQNETLSNIEGFFEIISASIKAGFINAREIAVNSLTVTSEVISPVINADRLYTNIISPLASDSAITVNGKLVIDSSLEVKGNASFSGTVNSLSLQTNDASISGTLRAKNILADSIIYSTNFMNIASYSAALSDIPDFAAEHAQFSQGLMVFGPTSLSDLAVAGRLSLGKSMFVTENSIETLGADLSLQSLRQGGLSLMGGLVYVDTEGNVRIKGDLSVSGKLAVNIISPYPTADLVVNNASGSGILSVNQAGDVIASGSGTFAKLNFSLIQPVLAISAIEVMASSSAGVTSIAPYQSEITIRNPFVTDKSVIYITPVGTPSAQTPFLMRQIPQKSFTVGVQSPTNLPIGFNWLIIN